MNNEIELAQFTQLCHSTLDTFLPTYGRFNYSAYFRFYCRKYVCKCPKSTLALWYSCYDCQNQYLFLDDCLQLIIFHICGYPFTAKQCVLLYYVHRIIGRYKGGEGTSYFSWLRLSASASHCGTHNWAGKLFFVCRTGLPVILRSSRNQLAPKK